MRRRLHDLLSACVRVCCVGCFFSLFSTHGRGMKEEKRQMKPIQSLFVLPRQQWVLLVCVSSSTRIDQMQKHHDHDPIPMTTADDPAGSGRVKQSKFRSIIDTSHWHKYADVRLLVRQQFLEHSDFGLANRLQEEECELIYSLLRLPFEGWRA